MDWTFVRRQNRRKMALFGLTLGVALLLIVGAIVIVAVYNGSSEDGNPGMASIISEAEEATELAETELTAPQLYFVASGSEGIHTFQFTESESGRELAVTGPYRDDPAFPAWVVGDVQERPAGAPDPVPLNLRSVQKSPGELIAAAQERTFVQQDSWTYSLNGELQWTLNGGNFGIMRCDIHDSAEIASLTCNPSPR